MKTTRPSGRTTMLIVWVLIIGLVSSFFAGAAFAEAAAPPSLGAFPGEAAIGHLRALAGTIGPRPFASEGWAKAVEYIVSALGSAGCEVRTQTFRAKTDTSSAGRREMTFSEGINVLGTIVGKTRAGFLIVAHYDSTSLQNPGADDNASGVACLLGLAEALRGRRSTHSVYFLAADQEELGLFGSRAFCAEAGQNGLPSRGDILAVIDLDMTATGREVYISSSQPASPPDLVDAALEAAGGCGVPARVNVESGSDHTIFLNYGIPAVRIGDDCPIVNTPLDTLDKIDAGRLNDFGRVTLTLIERLDGLSAQRLLAMRGEIGMTGGGAVMTGGPFPTEPPSGVTTIRRAAGAWWLILVFILTVAAFFASRRRVEGPAADLSSWPRDVTAFSYVIALSALAYLLGAGVVIGAAAAFGAGGAVSWTGGPWSWAVARWGTVGVIISVMARLADRLAAARPRVRVVTALPKDARFFWRPAVVAGWAVWFTLFNQAGDSPVMPFSTIPGAVWSSALLIAFIARDRPAVAVSALAVGLPATVWSVLRIGLAFSGPVEPVLFLSLVFSTLAVYRGGRAGAGPPRWIRRAVGARWPRLGFGLAETVLAIICAAVVVAISLTLRGSSPGWPEAGPSPSAPSGPPSPAASAAPGRFARVIEVHHAADGSLALVLGRSTEGSTADAVLRPAGLPGLPERFTLTGRDPSRQLSAADPTPLPVACRLTARATSSAGASGDRTISLSVVIQTSARSNGEGPVKPRNVALTIAGGADFDVRTVHDPWVVETAGTAGTAKPPATPATLSLGPWGGPGAALPGTRYQFYANPDSLRSAVSEVRTYLMPQSDLMVWEFEVGAPADAPMTVYVDVLYDGFLVLPYDLQAPATVFERYTIVEFEETI